MPQERKLGRGLDALFEAKVDDDATSIPNTLSLDDIDPNPEQPRQEFDETKLGELAASIKSQGIIQPLLVRPKGGRYQLVAGERRWRAAKLAGLTEVPVLVRDLSDEEVMVSALIENLQREDLNPVDEAIALKTLRETLKMTQDALAAKLGKSRPAIANALRLLQLSEAAQNDLKNGRISAGHARSLLSLDDPDAAERLRQRIIAASLTVRDAEDAVCAHKASGVFPWENAATCDAEPKKGNSCRRKKSDVMLRMQKDIASALAVRASMSGDETKGRITISYQSPEELRSLLEKFGVEPLL